MKIHIHLIAILLFAWSMAAAQPGFRKEAKEKIKALHKAYINDQLELTDGEAAAFWPVYEEYRARERDLLKEMKPAQGRRDNLTEEEAQALMEKRLGLEEKRLALKREYLKKLNGLIPASKIVRLERAEQKFKREVVRRLKERRERMRD